MQLAQSRGACAGHLASELATLQVQIFPPFTMTSSVQTVASPWLEPVQAFNRSLKKQCKETVSCKMPLASG